MNGRKAKERRQSISKHRHKQTTAIMHDAVRALKLMEMQHPLNLLGEKAIREYEELYGEIRL